MTPPGEVLVALALLAQQPPAISQAPLEPPPTAEEIEEEVLGNIRRQALGAGTVEDLGLPEPFLRRIADRVIRASYEKDYRIVVKDQAPPAKEPPRRSIGSALAIGLVVFTLCAAGMVGVVLRRRRSGSGP